MLLAAPEVVVRRRDGSELRRSTLHPGHIAVLVRVNSHAVLVRDALQAAGVPAVIGGSVSVFATKSATEWLRLLEALERPTARDRASLAALTCFIGWTPERVATATEEEWEDLHWSLHRWAALLRDEGIASLYETVSGSHDVPARVLAGTAGERFMTDLRHIGQLLHEAGVSEGLGPTAMATWLGRRIHDADKDTDNEERARRLESDAAAVQVITIHRSKGLEFPIVLCPYMWDGRPQKNDVPVFHDPHNGHRRTIDVGQDGKGFPVHQKMEFEEGRGEDLRLLYVALTRARTSCGPLVGRRAGQRALAALPASLRSGRPWHGQRVRAGRHTDDEVEAAFVGLDPLVGVERVGQPAGGRWHPDPGNPPDLEPAVFDRLLDVGWRRVSYSGITRALHDEPAVGSEPELELTSDEETSAAPPSGSTEPTTGTRVALHLGAMPGGALVGTVVHGVLERTDFAAPDLDAEIRDALAKELAWHNVDLGTQKPWSRGSARRSSRRSARWSAGLDFVMWRGPTDSTSSASRSHWSAAMFRRGDSTLRTWPTSCRRGYPGRPGRPLRAGIAQSGAQRRAARLPDGKPRPCPEASRRPLRRGRLQDQQAGSAGRGAHGLALPAAKRWTRRWLRRTTRSRRCSTRSPCTGTCAGGFPATTRAALRWGALSVRAGHERRRARWG